MTKKIMVFILVLGISINPLCAGLMVHAASKVKAVKAQIVIEEERFFVAEIYLDQHVPPARNFQSYERKEEPSDFPDLMVAATRENFYFNGISWAEYREAMPTDYSMLLFHCEDTDDGKSVLRLWLCTRDYLPEGQPILIEVKDGAITADYKRITPFVAYIKNPQMNEGYFDKTQPMELHEAGWQPKQPSSSSEATSSAPVTTSSAVNVSEPDSSSAADTSSQFAADTSSGSGLIKAPLGSYDVVSKLDGMTVDFDNKLLALSDSLSVQEVRGGLSLRSGLEAKFFDEGGTEITDTSYKLTPKDTMRIYEGEDEMGIFAVSLDKETGGMSGKQITAVVLLIFGALVIGGGIVYFVLMRRRGANE